jgi:hypothetical protein
MSHITASEYFSRQERQARKGPAYPIISLSQFTLASFALFARKNSSIRFSLMANFKYVWLAFQQPLQVIF